MRYEEPSIIEALCEFVFEPSQQWDWTVFGKFAAQMPELEIREQGEVVTIDVKGGPDSLAQQLRKEPRMRFYGQDRTRLAQVGQNLLAANVLPPYPHWEEFRDFIMRTLQAYRDSVQPTSIRKATLRYIDRIRPDSRPVTLGDWVNPDSPYVPSFLRDSQRPAHSRAQRHLDSGLETVSVQLQLEADGEATIMLDTEVVRLDMMLDPETVVAHLDALHGRIVDVFESCISDRTRTLLKPVG